MRRARCRENGQQPHPKPQSHESNHPVHWRIWEKGNYHHADVRRIGGHPRTVPQSDMSTVLVHPEDVLFITRLEDHTGILKVTIVKDKIEIPGVELTDSFVRSFCLWLSVVSGKLPQIDLVLLRRDHGSLLWMSWPEVTASIQERIANCSKDEYHLFVAESSQELEHPPPKTRGKKTQAK